MKTESSKRLNALPLQMIATDNGVILKRGCTETRISGRGSAQALHVIFSATTGQGATSEQICDAFTALEQPVAKRLIEHLVARNFLVPTDERCQSSADA